MQVLLLRERVDLSLRPSGYTKWCLFSPGTGERREFTIRCTELPGLRDLGRLNYDDFKFAKRVSGLLRGYDHKFLEPHHRHIPLEFDDQLYLNFESMYSYLKKRFRAQLSKQDLYLILRTQDRFMCRIEAGVVGELTTLDMPYRITHVKACQGHDQSLIKKVGTAPYWSSRSSRLTTSSRWKISKEDSTRGSRFIHTWRKLRSQKSFASCTTTRRGALFSRSFAPVFFRVLRPF